MLMKFTPAINFINAFCARFFVQKFVQTQSPSREKTFKQKNCAKNVDEIDTCSQFHQF